MIVVYFIFVSSVLILLFFDCPLNLFFLILCKISISFRLENDQSIIVKIIDNGIGRQKAEEIKQKKLVDVKHESRGMKLIKDKINILKEQFESEIFIELSDVNNDNGDICGTCVVIQLPLQY